ncbi:MAG: hypothetical protein IKN72_07395 [Clostridia bacterium]|nr:hypothetical protein [Clostridia bacterium]MBR3553198.1 hypothetical protein [Clostridia bacterium]
MKKKTFQQFLIVCVIALAVYYVALGIAAQKINPTDPPKATIPATAPTQPSATAAPTASAVPTDPAAPTDPAVTNPDVPNQVPDTVPTDYLPTVTTQSDPAVTLPTASTAPTTTAPAVPSSKADIVAAYINAVNQLKATPNFTLTKNDQLNVAIDEMDPDSVRGFADSMIASSKQNSQPKTYHFSGGSDPTSGFSATHVIAPTDRNAALSPGAVTSATATPTGDGGYRIHLTLGTEKQTMTSPAPNYSTVMEVINPDTLGLPSNAKIDDFNITYSGGTIDATIDSQGRITAMTHHLVVPEATGSGSLMVAVTLKMHGDHTATYQITY